MGSVFAPYPPRGRRLCGRSCAIFLILGYTYLILTFIFLWYLIHVECIDVSVMDEYSAHLGYICWFGNSIKSFDFCADSLMSKHFLRYCCVVWTEAMIWYHYKQYSSLNTVSERY